MAWLSGILAPVAFSPRCHGALQYAETLGCHFHSELTLLHVVSPPLGAISAPDAGAYTSVEDLTEERLAQANVELAGYLEDPCPNVQVTRAAVAGDPAHRIVEQARVMGAGLIVMATHGYGPFRRFLLGSVTAKVLHDAPCPVWTGPHLEQAPSYQTIGFRRVMCAIDLLEASAAVLAWAGQFAREFGATLDIVHVLPHTLVQLGGLYFDPEWRADVAHAARDGITRLQQDTNTAGEIFIEFGEPPAAVHDLAAHRKADVVVIGRGRENGLAGRLRATAYGILRESPCPVAAI
jgi:nucleotide-binding universal stress UspA family protein